MLLRPTLRLLAQQVYKPSIRFPDRQQQSSAQQQHEPHPHPAAPPEIVKDFGHFQEVFSSGPHFHPEKLQQAGSGSEAAAAAGGNGAAAAAAAVAEDLHDLPPRYWRTSSLAFEDDELEAVMTGGASLR